MVTKTRFARGIVLKPDDTASEAIAGELKVGATSKELEVHLDGAVRTVVTENQAQTLSAKGIDADTNTIANIELDNLKAGVLNTSTTLATASNLQVPSALAVKTYIDDKAAAQNEASEISFAPVGNIAATTVQAMGAELDNDLSAEITARGMADTTLQTNIDNEATARIGVQTNLTTHINNASGAHAASAISNVAAGNLAATTVQAALDELQTDIDTRALSSALTTHEALTVSHGATGAVVGTTNTQTLTNKTLTAPVVNSPTGIVKADVGLSAVDNTSDATKNAATATLINKTLTSPIINTPTGIVKADVGLGNVDNTSDANKPVSTAQQTALNLKANIASPTFTGVPLAPTAAASNNTTQVATTAYADTAVSTLSGTTTASLALKANIASPTFTGTVSGITSTMVGLGNVDNTSDATKNAATVTLTNKTLTAPILNSPSVVTPSRADVKQDTKANLVTYATTASNGQIVFATDEKLMYQVVDSSLVAVGGSSGSLDTILQLLGDDVSSWTTGDNATFLGAGALSGTFAANTTSPLQNITDYKYTQAAGSLNDYLAAPAKTVDVRFRGKEATLYFPYTYDGANNDIQVVFYDVTNAAIIPSSVFIQASTAVATFRTNIAIPLTCASIRVGFQTVVLNSGKILQFDSVQLSADTTLFANLFAPDYAIRLNTGNDHGSTNTCIRRFTNIVEQIGTDVTYTDSSVLGGKFVINTAGIYDISYTDSFGAVNAPFGVTKNSASLTTSVSTVSVSTVLTRATADTAQSYYSTSWSGQLEVGDVIRAHTNGAANATSQARVHFSISKIGKNSQNILTAPETFSTDTAPLAYAGSAAYTLATLTNAPVGTFITFTYAASTNTRTQTTTAPTQTTADMNTNGIRLYHRVFASTSTAALPAYAAVQIGKGLKGINLGWYKSTGKTTPGSLDLFIASVNALQSGMWTKEYNEQTGILILDPGYNLSSAVVTNRSNFSDDTNQTDGYLVINASKNPVLVGIGLQTVAASVINTAGTSMTNSGAFVVIPYDAAKVYDTHSSINSTTGVFTAPETGYYQVSGGVYFASSTYAIGNSVNLTLFKNASSHKSGFLNIADRAAAFPLFSNISTGVYLIKNETLELRVQNNRTAGATLLDTTVGVTFFTVHRTSIGTGN